MVRRSDKYSSSGIKCFSKKGDELLCEVTLGLFLGGSFDRLCVRVGRMDGQASRLALDVEGKFEFLIFRREPQAREFRD
jgi:hypothetical protein